MLKPFFASLVLFFAFAPAPAQDRSSQSMPAPDSSFRDVLLEERYVEGSINARPWHLNQHSNSIAAPVLVAVMWCFLTGEQTAGMNKICYYNCLGSPAAITIGAVELCPLSINR